MREIFFAGHLPFYSVFPKHYLGVSGQASDIIFMKTSRLSFSFRFLSSWEAGHRATTKRVPGAVFISGLSEPQPQRIRGQDSSRRPRATTAVAKLHEGFRESGGQRRLGAIFHGSDDLGRRDEGIAPVVP